MTEENTNTTPAAAYVPSPQVRFNQAIAANDLKAAEVALKDGADIDMPLTDGGANVLMKAANDSATNKDESYKLAKWALNHGADANTIKNSSTPLLRAVESKALPLARLLLDNGANPNFPDMDKSRIGGTIGRPAQLPLHRAAFNGNEPMVRLLLRKGADINAPSRDGATPLWYAATNRRVRVSNILLDAGASPDAVYDDRGTVQYHPMSGTAYNNGRFKTALHEFQTYQMRDSLMYEDRYNINKALLDAGADVFIKDSTGKTPRQAIETQENGARMAELFKTYEQYKPFDPEKLPGLRRKHLFALDENGNTLLDSPSTWKHFDAIATHLKGIGEPLKMEDLHAKNKDGKMWLERGVECLAVKDIIKHVAPAHEPDSLSKLFKATRPIGEATDVDLMPDALRTAGRRMQLGRIFSPELWEGRTKGEVRTLYSAIAEGFHDDITSYQQIQLNLPAQRPGQGKGIGRYEVGKDFGGKDVGGGFSR